MRASIALLMLLVACGPAVDVQRDPGWVPPLGATYAWGEKGTPELAGEGAPELTDATLQARIEVSIDTLLAQRGFRLVPADSAALLVHYHVGLERRRSVQTVVVAAKASEPAATCSASACWPDFSWGAYGPPHLEGRPMQYTEGALLVDLQQRRTGAVVFRAVGRDQVTAADASDDRIRDAVRHVLAALPAAR